MAGTKLMRRGRLERYVALEIARIKDLLGVVEQMDAFQLGGLEGRVGALTRMIEYFDLEDVAKEHWTCEICGDWHAPFEVCSKTLGTVGSLVYRKLYD